MTKLTAAFCCLMLAAAPVVAQVKNAEKKAAPMTPAERAAKNKAFSEKSTRCNAEARNNRLVPGSKEFINFMGNCQRQ